jgi:ABC-type glycerol-3-phosphate transport system permease component
MLSTVLVYLCIKLECFLQGLNAFYRVGIPLYRVGMLSTGLECFLEVWNAFDRVGIPLYTVGMLSTGLECFRQCWYTFVQSWNAF